MNIDEFEALVKTRRSRRKYKPDPIPDESIRRILDTARYAMSGANAQPWEFIVVKDPKVKLAMAEIFLKTRDEHYYLEQMRAPDLIPGALKNFPKGLPAFKDAPALIVVLGDRRTFIGSVIAGSYIGNGGSIDATFQKGMGNVTMLIQLAAASMGLGSQWITVIDNYAIELRPLLGVPSCMQIHHIVPIGYPADTLKPSYRRSLDEIIHFDKYDMSKFRSGDKIVDFIRNLRENTFTGVH
jgi:5,6-dimethylbenzimidazole synthase